LLRNKQILLNFVLGLNTMKIGIIGNSGGSYFAESYRILKESTFLDLKFYAISDRNCGFATFCENNNIPHRRIDEKDKREFSLLAKNYFEKLWANSEKN